jgi:hypothetical protein
MRCSPAAARCARGCAARARIGTSSTGSRSQGSPHVSVKASLYPTVQCRALTSLHTVASNKLMRMPRAQLSASADFVMQAATGPTQSMPVSDFIRQMCKKS